MNKNEAIQLVKEKYQFALEQGCNPTYITLLAPEELRVKLEKCVHTCPLCQYVKDKTGVEPWLDKEGACDLCPLVIQFGKNCAELDFRLEWKRFAKEYIFKLVEDEEPKEDATVPVSQFKPGDHFVYYSDFEGGTDVECVRLKDPAGFYTSEGTPAMVLKTGRLVSLYGSGKLIEKPEQLEPNKLSVRGFGGENVELSLVYDPAGHDHVRLKIDGSLKGYFHLGNLYQGSFSFWPVDQANEDSLGTMPQ